MPELQAIKTVTRQDAALRRQPRDAFFALANSYSGTPAFHKRRLQIHILHAPESIGKGLSTLPESDTSERRCAASSAPLVRFNQRDRFKASI